MIVQLARQSVGEHVVLFFSISGRRPMQFVFLRQTTNHDAFVNPQQVTSVESKDSETCIVTLTNGGTLQISEGALAVVHKLSQVL